MKDSLMLRPRQIASSPLNVRGLVSGYEKGPDIVRKVSLTIRPGSFVAILGANGCGKTTLLKTLLGLLPARSGSVECGGTDILSLDEKKRALHLAYIPQAHRPPFPYKVSDVVRMGRTPYLGRMGIEKQEDLAVAHACLEQVHMECFAEHPYTKLSGGQKQLVLIARALAQQASFLIMDEPTTSLDYGNQFRVLNQIRKLCAYGMGILMVTHDPAHCFHAADEVMLMEKGEIIEDASPAEVMTSDRLSGLYDLAVHVQGISLPHHGEQHVCIPLNSEKQSSE